MSQSPVIPPAEPAESAIRPHVLVDYVSVIVKLRLAKVAQVRENRRNLLWWAGHLWEQMTPEEHDWAITNNYELPEE